MHRHSVRFRFTDDELREICRKCDADRQIFHKNDTILSQSSDDDRISIIDSGCAYLVSININGGTAIIDIYEEGDIFSKLLFPLYSVNLYYVYAKKQTEVTMLSVSRLKEGYLSGDPLLTKFYELMLMNSNSQRMIHNDVLSQKTIREKLMTYFRYISLRSEKSEIVLPISLADLADYIAVDRSAMMREIRNLNNEHIIHSKGIKINLLQHYK